MLENVELDKKVDKDQFAERSTAAKEKLYLLQRKIREAGIPVIIVFEGWGTSGKGSRIADLIANWDPRGYKVYSITARDEAERRLPPMARYWRKIPERGQIAVFDRSWYRDIHTEYLDDDLPKDIWKSRVADINIFERQMSDNGYLIIKFFLHISKQEQKKRFEELRTRKNTAWRVTRADQKHHAQYGEYYKTFNKIFSETSTENAPWNIISATDKRYATITIFESIISAIDKTLAQNSRGQAETPAAPVDGSGDADCPSHVSYSNFTLLETPRLDDIDLSRKTDESAYEKKLEKLQSKLSILHNKLYRKKVPIVIAFEGWDGAGKGGGIKRLTRALDPRGYEVIPIASPSLEEKNRQFLWRFWNALPRTGHIVIFDRTWYGRCLVERVEGFCLEADWKRSYNEINEFENYLYRQGIILIKFWLQIDKDEQLRRFQERENVPEKQWKITDEDWRNREKWDLYKEAAQDIFSRTSTDFAPWNIIEGNDKYFARLRILETIIENIEARLT